MYMKSNKSKQLLQSLDLSIILLGGKFYVKTLVFYALSKLMEEKRSSNVNSLNVAAC